MPTTITTDPEPRRPGFTRAEKVLMALGAALVLCCAVAIAYMTLGPGSPAAGTIGGPFTLTASDGRTVTDRDFRGKYTLVYFGYTFCPDVCPTTMADLGIAMKALGPQADRVQPLFITVDPARDTAEVLKAYTAQFSPRLLGLTGSPEQIAVVEKQYKVFAQVERTGKGPDDYVVDHASVFYLMDPQGRFAGVIRADQDGKATAADIARYLS